MGRVDVDGVGIEYDVTGDGPPVVLLHGFPATFRRTARQREKSWYMLLFRFPGIAGRWLTGDDWSSFRTWAGHPDAGQVIAGLEAAGSLTPGLNWYRAGVPPGSRAGPPLQLPPVQAAAMGVWRTADPALRATEPFPSWLCFVELRCVGGLGGLTGAHGGGRSGPARPCGR